MALRAQGSGCVGGQHKKRSLSEGCWRGFPTRPLVFGRGNGWVLGETNSALGTRRARVFASHTGPAPGDYRRNHAGLDLDPRNCFVLCIGYPYRVLGCYPHLDCVVARPLDGLCSCPVQLRFQSGRR